MAERDPRDDAGDHGRRPYSVVFVHRLPHGICVGVTLPPPDATPRNEGLDALHHEEIAHAATLSPRRRASWAGGRVALRRALAVLAACAEPPSPPSPPWPSSPLMATSRGAPAMPEGLVGSVSHKDDIAVALVDRDTGGHIGVDVEIVAPRPTDISRFVLTPRECEVLLPMGEPERRRQVLLSFSVKEAIYKAIDPFVRRYVGFHEVELDFDAPPNPDGPGTARITPLWKNGEGPFSVDVWWRREDNRILSSARIYLSTQAGTNTARGR